MKTISQTDPYLNSNPDLDVAWAQRKDTINTAVKLFRILLDAVRKQAEWVETRHGIHATQLMLLWELAQSPGMRSIDLVRALSMSRSDVEALLVGLETKGLVWRTQAGSASAHAFVTDEGQHLANSAPLYGQGVIKAALAHLPDKTLNELTHALTALTEQLPFREDSAAYQPMPELLRPSSAASPLAAPPSRKMYAFPLRGVADSDS